jgi:hypothetical protein
MTPAKEPLVAEKEEEEVQVAAPMFSAVVGLGCTSGIAS